MRDTSYFRGYSAGLRAAVRAALGGKCKNCGGRDARTLQADHTKGGGSAHRRLVGRGDAYYRAILRSLKSYTLRCANCNARKRHTHKEGVR